MVTETRQNKILIVDDEINVRRTINKKLTKEGFACIEASNSLEAMEKIKEYCPDLVILDIMMPGKSGRELLPEIVSSNPHIAAIMATAVADPKTIIECMKSGANDYITKPFDLAKVTETVNMTLLTKRLEEKLDNYNTELENTFNNQKKQIREMFLNSIEALVSALEAKDKYTAGHSRRVTQLALDIGKQMVLSEDQLEDLHWGALLHDVGKIAIDPAIQNKPGQLNSEEYQHMMTHSMVGAGIVKPVANEKTIEIIIHHHDHYDGAGLGQITKGDEIPLFARIVAVADTFDAMTSDRPYRSAMSTGQAVAEIKKCAGTQLDPKIVEMFTKIPQDDKSLVTPSENLIIHQ